MITKIWQLPNWIASEDDKPCLELFNYYLSKATFYNADTLEHPTLDNIVVQSGLANNDLYNTTSFNYIQLTEANGNVVWYRITNVHQLEDTIGVYEFDGEIDIYLTYLMAYFSTANNTNGTPVYFKRKHLNRFTYLNPFGIGDIYFGYVCPDYQFYLLAKEEDLNNVGSKVKKTPIYCHAGDYFSHAPSATENLANGYKGMSISKHKLLDGQIPVETTVNNRSPGLNYFTINGAWYSGCDMLVYPNFYTNTYNVANPSNTNYASECYPCILWNVTANENYLLPSCSTPELANSNATFPTNFASYPFPYALGGVGGIQIGASCGNVLAEDKGGIETAGVYSTNSAFLFAGPPWYDLCLNGEISDKYYTGIYLLPLPINCYFNQWDEKHSNPWTTWVTVGNVNGIASFRATMNKAEWDGTGIMASNKVSYLNTYWPCFDPVIYIAQNNLYTLWNGTVPQLPDLTYIEPAIITYERFNVRMYGQDNTIMVDAFTELYANTNFGCMEGLIPFLMSFTITVAPPNMMLTNCPTSMWNKIVSYSSSFGDDIAFNNIRVWNYNNFNDAIYSCVLKSQAPNVSNAWNNYMATSKNAYDTGLNVSQLMAQKSLLNTGESIASGNGGNPISEILNPIGDIMSFASQEIQYAYKKTGMKQDMSRTSNMRTSATSTINTLFDSSFLLVAETPVEYEQIAVVNYHALRGYKLERWNKFNSWNNRKYCNFVSIAYFTNTMLPHLNIYWKVKIDKLLNTGFRVWSNTTELQQAQGWVPYETVLFNANNGTYNNVELNQNNEELEFLNNGTYEEIANLDVQATKENKSH